MMPPLSQLLGYSSGIVSFIAYLPYIRDIIWGNTKPTRGTFFIWTVLGSIAFFSQAAKGATYSLWMTGVQAAGVLIIFLLSLWRGHGGLTKRDQIALGVAGTGLLLWYFTKDAAYALILVILIDAAGAVLCVLKAYDHPETETLEAWVLWSTGGLLATLAVGRFDPLLLSYPVYIVLMNTSAIVAILLGRRRQYIQKQSDAHP